MRILALLLSIATGFALSGCLQSVLYYPTKTAPAVFDHITGKLGWTLTRLRTEPGIELVGLEKAPQNADAPWVLFFGGNGMSIENGVFILEKLRGEAGSEGARDWGTAAFAYRGYDGSTGKPSEQGLVADAVAIVHHLMTERGVAPSRLFVMGLSLGTGVAVQATARLIEDRVPIAGLILIAPFTNIKAVATEMIPLIPTGWLLEESYDTRSYLKKLQLPVLVIHGAKDNVISVEHGKRIARELGVRATFHEISKRSHNDVILDLTAVALVREFVR